MEHSSGSATGKSEEGCAIQEKKLKFLHQLENLFIDLGRILDRLGNFGPENFAKSPAQAMGGGLDADDDDVHGPGDVGVGDAGRVAPQVRFERVEQFGPARNQEFGAQPV